MNKNVNIFVGYIAEEKQGLSLINELLKLDTKTEATLRIIKLNIVLVADRKEKSRFMKSW